VLAIGELVLQLLDLVGKLCVLLHRFAIFEISFDICNNSMYEMSIQKYHRHLRGICSVFPLMKLRSISHFRMLL
jgi:hypothetical protein